MNKLLKLNEGLQTAYIDQTYSSNLAYRPQFVSNDYRKGKKVLATIEDELHHCDEFIISVAFLTLGGITPLLQTFKELEQKGIKGKILTTDYLMFSEPRAIEKLQELTNISIKIYRTKGKEGFHTKGYIFQKNDLYRIVIGSSNMTLSALTVNKEWNNKVIATKDGEVTKDIMEEFETLWHSSNAVDARSYIEQYKIEYKIIKEQKRIAKQEEILSIEQYKLQPNSMQLSFIQNLMSLKRKGENRALLLSATGTGKTYAAAFALRELKIKKALFVVHREQIAKQAIKSFQNVFGTTAKMGLLSGTSKQYDCDFLFATMQMMSKEEVYQKFSPTEFEVVIIDEVHRVGAYSYQKIMEHFQPELYLGMTASPDRTDGFDIYQLFHHNIACEIRLQQALEEDMLCPFHYFGITDLEIDGNTFDEDTKFRNFQALISENRVCHIIEKAKYFGYSGERVKGLIFCSRKSEARELSNKFNERGYKTVCLSGEDSQERREEVIDRLTSDKRDDILDYIFTVDIFNEGVDIPEINQVIMLRPTESPIVFVQQLGRGLRKAEDKEFVVVLDFIGNYTNNFMIPIALSGDRSYNKDNIRRYIREGERIIPGCSTIHFDEITQSRIYESIDTANFSDIKLIKENYFILKNRLGHIPSMNEFHQYGEMDVLRIFENKGLGSYYKFLVKYEKEYTTRLSSVEAKFIEFLSKKLANGKRIHELEFIKRAMLYATGILHIWQTTLANSYGIQVNNNTINNVKNILTNEFPTGSGKKTYSECILIEESQGEIRLTKQFIELLKNPNFKEMVLEIIEFGIIRYKQDYNERYKETSFNLYQKYTYEDVCRLLEWEHNEVPLNIGGYKYDVSTKTFPVFINYHKEEGISNSIRYEDRFLSENRLIAISKQGRSIQSEDVQNFLKAKERGICVDLFVRKNKDDKISKEFYYLGHMNASGYVKEFIMENTNKSAVEIEWILDTPVREDIYNYIISE